MQGVYKRFPIQKLIRYTPATQDGLYTVQCTGQGRSILTVIICQKGVFIGLCHEIFAKKLDIKAVCLASFRSGPVANCAYCWLVSSIITKTSSFRFNPNLEGNLGTSSFRFNPNLEGNLGTVRVSHFYRYIRQRINPYFPPPLLTKNIYFCL